MSFLIKIAKDNRSHSAAGQLGMIGYLGGHLAGTILGGLPGASRKNRYMTNAGLVGGATLGGAIGAAAGSRLGDRLQYGKANTEKKVKDRKGRSKIYAGVGAGLGLGSGVINASLLDGGLKNSGFK